MNAASFHPLSPDEITKRGEKIYINELKDKLEKNRLGNYAVIEVKTKKHFVNKDLVAALETARKEFPRELFFIVQIGKLQTTLSKNQSQRYDWLF